MYERIKDMLKRHWYYFLVSFALVCFLLNVLIFYPGYMSNDSIGQLSQAMNKQELTDLTPIALVILWKLLIHFTGHVGAMLVFQLGVLWAALCLIATFVYRKSKSYLFSFLVLIIGLLPFVINISGVIWKDNQMAFSLLLAVAGILYLPYITLRRNKVLILAVVLLLILYAGLVRYNALIALMPLIFVAIKQAQLITKLRFQVLATALFTLVIVMALQILTVATHAKQSNPISAVMLDDIVNVAEQPDLAKSSIPSNLASALISAKSCSEDKKLLLNNFWLCVSDQQRESIEYKDYGALKKEWLSLILKHPFAYMGYRIETYFLFLFPPENAYYVWQDGIVPNGLNQQVKYERLGEVTSIYVNNFGYKTFRPLFEPWLWLVLSIVILSLIKKFKKEFQIPVFAIGLSSLLYLFSFAPTGATVDYRYIYWPVLACSLSLLLLMTTKSSHLSKE